MNKMVYVCGFCHKKDEKGSDKELLAHLDSCPQYLKKHPYANYKKYFELKRKGIIAK